MSVMVLPSGPFTEAQLRLCDILARVSACLSLSGTLFTTTSYIFCPALRKPFNRLAFVIAIANAFGCFSYSWGYYPLFYPRNSAFCQTQAFLIQWFVMADPFVVLTMAVSVWMTVQARRTAEEIRRFETIGMTLAFVLPFIPALVFLWWRPQGHTVYGPAVLWCFISQQSSKIRIAGFYAPIWFAILFSLIFFALSGRRILRVRAKVNKAQSNPPQPRERRFSTFRFKAWSFTHRHHDADSRPSSHGGESVQVPASAHLDYAISGTPVSPARILPTRPTPSSSFVIHDSDADIDIERIPTVADHDSTATSRRPSQATALRRRSTRFEQMHWKYARFAFSCTIVLFITWIPISVNRMRSFLYPNDPIYGLYVASAVCIPLHGFGNFVVYVNTSWEECKAWTLSLLDGGWFTHFRRSKSGSGQ